MEHYHFVCVCLKSTLLTNDKACVYKVWLFNENNASTEELKTNQIHTINCCVRQSLLYQLPLLNWQYSNWSGHDFHSFWAMFKCFAGKMLSTLKVQ